MSDNMQPYIRGGVQHSSRRDQPRVQLPQRRVSTTNHRRHSTQTVANRLHLKFGVINRKAIQNAIGNSSRRAYGTGFSHWIHFGQQYDIPSNGQIPDCDLDFVFACFASFLILEHGIQSSTVSCYISHVIRYLIEERLILDSTSIRTDYLKSLLKGYVNANTQKRWTNEMRERRSCNNMVDFWRWNVQDYYVQLRCSRTEGGIGVQACEPMHEQAADCRAQGLRDHMTSRHRAMTADARLVTCSGVHLVPVTRGSKRLISMATSTGPPFGLQGETIRRFEEKIRRNKKNFSGKLIFEKIMSLAVIIFNLWSRQFVFQCLPTKAEVLNPDFWISMRKWPPENEGGKWKRDPNDCYMWDRYAGDSWWVPLAIGSTSAASPCLNRPIHRPPHGSPWCLWPVKLQPRSLTSVCTYSLW